MTDISDYHIFLLNQYTIRKYYNNYTVMIIVVNLLTGIN